MKRQFEAAVSDKVVYEIAEARFVLRRHNQFVTRRAGRLTISAALLASKYRVMVLCNCAHVASSLSTVRCIEATLVCGLCSIASIRFVKLGHELVEPIEFRSGFARQRRRRPRRVLRRPDRTRAPPGHPHGFGARLRAHAVAPIAYGMPPVRGDRGPLDAGWGARARAPNNPAR